MSQRHTTSCIERTCWENISNKYSRDSRCINFAHSLLSQMVGDPQLFFDRQLCCLILDRLLKNEQKVNVGSLKISKFSAHAASNLAHLSTARRVQRWSLNRVWFSLGTSPVESICLIDPLKQYLNKKIAFHGFIRDIFGQTNTVAWSETKANFYDLRVIFRTSYLRNEFGDPPFFYISDMSNP